MKRYSKLSLPAPIIHLGSNHVSLGAYILWKSRKDLQIAFQLDTLAGQEGLISWHKDQLFQLQAGHSLPLIFRILNAVQARLTELVHLFPHGVRRSMAHQWWRFRAVVMRKHGTSASVGQVDEALIKRSLETVDRGVNLVGYLRAEKGMGQILRSSIKTFSTTPVKFGVIDYRFGMTSRMRAPVDNIPTISGAIYNISIIYINADQLWSTIINLSQSNIFKTYVIAVWLWELERFPEEWEYALDLVDEIWAPSTFIHNALSRVTKKPVLHMPFSVEHAFVDLDSDAPPKKTFTVVYIFDASSYIKRKNPLAVIQAFLLAFSGKDKTVKLILKSMYGSSDIIGWTELCSAASSDNRISLINEVWSIDQIYDLIDNCDCYISLHRSEGFGFTIVEAMARGKPAIFTSYSGPTDFINDDGCCPVGYKLESLLDDDYPGSSCQVWAMPDVAEASQWLAKLRAHPELARRIGRTGASFVRSKFSASATGKLYASRVNDLSKEMESGSPIAPGNGGEV